ncbi:MAG: hypothetical protein ACO1OB_33325 [Archangium sp.]
MKWLAIAALVLAAIPGGALEFLHPLVRVPLVLAVPLLWWRPHWAAKVEVVCVSLLLINWSLLRVVGLHASRSDDSLYFYLAHRVTEDAVPYRDFFFAHPPLHLLVPALVFEVTGSSLAVGKAIPAVTHTLAAVALYFSLRNVSKVWALISLALHLNAYRVLMGATDLTGTNLVCALLAFAVLAATKQRPLISGVVAGLALGAGLYALPGVLALAWLQRSHLERYAGGVLAGLGAWLVPSALIGGAAFYEGVVRYHFARLPGVAAASPHETLELFVSNPLHVIAALLALVFLMKKPDQLALFALINVALFGVQWAALGRVHGYYTVPQVMFLSMLAGWALWRLSDLQPAAWAVASVAWVLIMLPLSRVATDRLWPDTSPLPDTKWIAPLVSEPVSVVVRALYFTEHRQRDAPGWQRYVWNKLRPVGTADEMAAFVKSRTTEAETIAGSSTLAPLVALLSHRRLAADEADTNAQRFSSGFLDEQRFFTRICNDRVRYLIAAPDSYFSDERLKNTPIVQRFFVREREFVETELRSNRAERYVFYRLRDGVSCAVDQ